MDQRVCQAYNSEEPAGTTPRKSKIPGIVFRSLDGFEDLQTILPGRTNMQSMVPRRREATLLLMRNRGIQGCNPSVFGQVDKGNRSWPGLRIMLHY